MSRVLGSALEDHRGLGLLLVLSSSAGCLGLPRFDQPDDNGSEGTETGLGTDDETGPAPTSAGPGPMPTTSPPPSTTTTGPGPSPTTSTTGPMTTVTTTPPPPVLDVSPPTYNVCTVYAETMEYCYGPGQGEESYDFCTEYLMDLENEQPECVPILEGFFVCLSTAECGDLFGPESSCEPLLQVFFECTQS